MINLIRRKSNRESLYVFSTIIVTVVVFAVLLKHIDYRKVATVIKHSSINFILAALTISITAHIILGAYRWKKIVNCLKGSLDYKNSLYITLANSPLEDIFPLKTGKFLKALYLARVNYFPLSLGAVSVAVNFILGFVSLLLMVILGLTLSFVLSSFSHVNIKVFLWSGNTVYYLRNKFIEKGKKFFSIIKQIPKEAIGVILALAFFMDFLQMVAFYLLGKALGIYLPFYKILIFVPLVIIISNLPFTVAGLGTREASVLFLFFHYAAEEDLLALGVLFSFIWYILPSLIGIVFTPSFLKRLSYD